MVFINKVGHFVLFGGKPKNCEIPDSFRKKLSIVICQTVGQFGKRVT